MNPFNHLILNSARRLAMPIGTYPGLQLVKVQVRDVVTNAQVQMDIQAALHQRYQTPFLMSAMDLSVEAEAFGAEIQLSETEIPTVTGRLMTSLEQARSLSVPFVGAGRTRVYIEAVTRLRKLDEAAFVVGGCIGPFSLAGRLVGVSEALELTITDPALMHTLLEKCTEFLFAYAQAFQQAGAKALLVAEPAAGLLSPNGLATFSSAYVSRIANKATDDGFSIILHNCGAKLIHLPAILSSGLKTFHFGAPMDLTAALAKVPSDVVLCGNLDPVSVFNQLEPAEVAERTSALLQATTGYKNFVISSGCDLPPNTPLVNLDAFHQICLQNN